MVRKILGKNSPGDSTHFASDDWDLMNGYLSNIDQSSTDPAKVATNTNWRDNRLRFWNLAMDHDIRIRTLNFTEDFDLTIPQITGDDELLLLLHDQQFQNKTINLSNGNVIKTTDIQLGDTLKSDGTGYKRVPLGTPGQVWGINDAGTDAEWRTATAGPTPPPPPGGPFIPDDDSVSAAKIQTGAVTTIKILDANVTNAKLAGSISGDKILSDAITTAKIANSQITDAKLAGSISGSKLLAGGVGTTQLADSGVTNAKLAGSIDQTKLLQITNTAKLPSNVSYKDYSHLGDITNDYGGSIGTEVTGAGCWGIMAPATTHRAWVADIGSDGPFIHTDTTTSINTLCGFKSTNAITRIEFEPTVYCKFSHNQITDINLFIGFSSSSASMPGTGNNWLNNLHGFGFAYHAGDGLYRWVRNNGSATDTEQSTGMPAAVTTPIGVLFEVTGNGASLTCSIYSDSEGYPDTPNRSDTFTTLLPSGSTSLWFHFVCNNITANQKSMDRYRITMKQIN